MLEAGMLIQNRYQIKRLIGKGGMGAVYEATDLRLKSTVALKQTLVNDSTLNKAFEREAQILANLRNPALTKVSDFFTDEKGQFLVMEYIPGHDLGELLSQRDSAFPLNEVLEWGKRLLDALDYLHTQPIPIIHRDIKPQNLKLTPRGEIILLDFGLAKGSATGLSQVTSDGSIFGYTPKYAPLEQIQGTGTDPRSDLYSLAATMYHLMSNKPPADALTRVSAVLNKQPDPLQPLHTLNHQIPEAISTVLMQALSLRSDERPTSAIAMHRALCAAQQAPPELQSGVVAMGPNAITIQAPAIDIPDPKAHYDISKGSAYTSDTIQIPQSISPKPDPYIQSSSSSQTQQKSPSGTKKLLLGLGVGLVAVVIFLCASFLGLFYGPGMQKNPGDGKSNTAEAIRQRQPNGKEEDRKPTTPPPPEQHRTESGNQPVLSPIPPTPTPTPTVLPFPEKQVDAVLNQVGGTFGVVVFDMQTSDFLYRKNDGESFPAASLIKLPIAMTIYDLKSRGELDVNEQLTMEDTDKVGGTGLIQSDPAGTRYALRDLCAKMLSFSDNTAANMVIKRLGGFDKVNDFLKQQIRANATQLNRKMLDTEAQKKGRDNITTPNDMLLLLNYLVLRKEEYQDIQDALLKTDDKAKLPTFSTGVIIMHKTGTLPTGVEHDVGIFQLPDGRRYIFVAMSKDLPDNKKGIETIARISQIVLDYEQQIGN